MDNKLTTWISSSFAPNIETKIKNYFSKICLLNEEDFTDIPKGFSFLYDEDSNAASPIHITFEEQGDTHFIQITGEYDWEVVNAYTKVQSLIVDIVEGAA
ncbi:hypothetical protein [Brevibacillus porteri]|uniref:hypothetical protein n=1 Tax=Brevibacillus porteri TaxID=2126350 RepID=UPI00363160A5